MLAQFGRDFVFRNVTSYHDVVLDGDCQDDAQHHCKAKLCVPCRMELENNRLTADRGTNTAGGSPGRRSGRVSGGRVAMGCAHPDVERPQLLPGGHFDDLKVTAACRERAALPQSCLYKRNRTQARIPLSAPYPRPLHSPTQRGGRLLRITSASLC